MKIPRHNKSGLLLGAVIGVVFLVLMICTIVGENGLLKLLRLKTLNQHVAQQNREILRANLELALEIQDLKNTGAVERVARESLGLAYPNETVFVKPSAR